MELMIQRIAIILYIAALSSFAPALLHAQWIRTNGPYGGYISHFATNSTTIFAGLSFGGVYRSTNNGGSWTDVSAGLPDGNVYAIAANDTDVYVYIAGIGYFDLYRSGDNGEHWTKADTNNLNKDVLTIVLKEHYLFAATQNEGSVYRSTDNGANWIQVNNGLTLPFPHTLAVCRNDIFATSISTVYRSSDNGESWSEVIPRQYPDKFIFLEVRDTTIFVVSLKKGTDLELLRSTDRGETWTAANSELKVQYFGALTTFGGDLYISINGGTFRSTDNGTTWAPVNSGLIGSRVTAFVSVGSYLFAGTNGNGVFRTSNSGAYWTEVNSNLTATTIHSLATSGADLFAGTSGGRVFRSTNNGANWTGDTSGLKRSIRVTGIVVSGDYVYAGLISGGVFRSSDNGATWTEANSGMTDSSITTLAVKDSFLFAGTSHSGVFRSSNNGEHWNSINTGLNELEIGHLLVKGSDLFVGVHYDGVLRSTDNGEHWIDANGISTNIGDLLATNGTDIIATHGGSGYSFIKGSSDNGASWSGSSRLYYLGALAASGSTFFAGTFYHGVFLSGDRGASWIQANEGSIDSAVFSFAVTGNDLFAGTESQGVWRRRLTEIAVGVDRRSPAPSTSSYIHIDPNPVISTAYFTHYLDRRAPVTVTIYNALGYVVAQPVVDVMQEAGEHQFALSTDGLAAGIYLCSVNASGFTQTVRFVVMR